MRAALCVFVRDLIVYGVLTDMMKGRPAIYATFSSYDEVAHHSGPRARGHARGAAQARPAVPADRAGAAVRGASVRDRRALRPRPDPGRDLQAAERLRPRRPRRAEPLRRQRPEPRGRATSRTRWSATRSARRPARSRRSRRRTRSADREVVVLGSGNLGLIYLMDEPRRLTHEEIVRRHPELIPALREHPHVGWLLVQSATHGAVVLGPRGAHFLDEGRVEGEDPLAPFSPTRRAPAPHEPLPARRRHHGRQLLRRCPRRGLRVRGADLVPRRPRRPADAGRSSSTPRARAPARADRRAPRPCTGCSPAGAPS